MPNIVSRKVLRHHFTSLPNDLIRCKDLSFKAKGILFAGLSCAENFHLNRAWFIGIATDGDSSVRAGLAELEQAGYLRRYRERLEDGRIGRMIYEWSDHPREVVIEFAGTDDDDDPDGGAPSGGKSTDGYHTTKKEQGKKEQEKKQPSSESADAPSDSGKVRPSSRDSILRKLAGRRKALEASEPTAAAPAPPPPAEAPPAPSRPADGDRAWFYETWNSGRPNGCAKLTRNREVDTRLKKEVKELGSAEFRRKVEAALRHVNSAKMQEKGWDWPAITLLRHLDTYAEEGEKIKPVSSGKERPNETEFSPGDVLVFTGFTQPVKVKVVGESRANLHAVPVDERGNPMPGEDPIQADRSKFTLPF